MPIFEFIGNPDCAQPRAAFVSEQGIKGVYQLTDNQINFRANKRFGQDIPEKDQLIIYTQIFQALDHCCAQVIDQVLASYFQG